MKLTKKQLDLKNAIQKEWLITNGIGGYASSTVLGANTRRYHGLLVAPLKPPARRHLILSKLDESILIEDKKFDLYTNVCNNYISEGYKHQESFQKEEYPEFVYKVEKVKITKRIAMVYGKNTVVVHYEIKNNQATDVKMTIAPILNFRDFHYMTTNHEFHVQQEIQKKIKIQIDDNLPIYMNCSDGNYIEHQQDIFRNMYYLKEEERGFFPEENLCVPGRYEILIGAKQKKDIYLLVSLEEEIESLEPNQVFEEEIARLQKQIKETKLLTNKSNLTKQQKEKNEFLKDLIIATDNFIINRPEFGLHSVLAGFPWFLDWGRDTCISFEEIGRASCRERV